MSTWMRYFVTQCFHEMQSYSLQNALMPDMASMRMGESDYQLMQAYEKQIREA